MQKQHRRDVLCDNDSICNQTKGVLVIFELDASKSKTKQIACMSQGRKQRSNKIPRGTKFTLLAYWQQKTKDLAYIQAIDIQNNDKPTHHGEVIERYKKLLE